MKNFAKVFFKVRDFIEVFLPTVSFSVMFLTFILQIVARYIFKYPLTWAYEVTVIGFSWTVIFGACYAMRNRSHVMFTLIYDHLTGKKAAVIRLLGNAIIFTAFLLLIVPSARYIAFMNFQSTAVFHVKLSWIFAPFVYFLVSISLYTLEEIIEDIKIIIKHKNDSGSKEVGGNLI